MDLAAFENLRRHKELRGHKLLPTLVFHDPGKAYLIPGSGYLVFLARLGDQDVPDLGSSPRIQAIWWRVGS